MTQQLPGGSLLPQTVSPASLTWVDDSGTADAIDFDLVLSEEWQQDAEVTEHPVEQGANVSDHVRVALAKCTLTVFATNEPLGSNDFAQATLGSVPVLANVWKSNIGLRGLVQGVAGGVGFAAAGTVGSAAGAAGGALAASLIPPGQAVPTPIAPNVSQFSAPTDFVEETIAKLLELKNNAQLVTLVGSKQTLENMVIETLGYMRSEDEGTGATITIGLKELRIVTYQQVPVPDITRAQAPSNTGMQNAKSIPNAQQGSMLRGLARYAGVPGPWGNPQ
jgi:hypothetical protein